MTKRLPRFALLLLFCLLFAVPVPAQRNAPINEKNIRAELGFLASDAMQGRGSATNYERIAAEYIGSQFRQFGLEPGGDADSAGNKTYVQRVALDQTGSRATWNVIGILKGSDPQLASDVI